MEWTYILIAAAIVILPFVLTKLLSGKSGDTTKVMGAYTPEPKPAVAPVHKRAVTPAHKPSAAPADSGDFTGQIRSLLAQGKKIEAIRLARDKTGFPLDAAKDMVETIEKAGGAAASPAPAAVDPLALIRDAKDLSNEVYRLVKLGNKIDAIKLVREKTGLGLKEAKDLVDRVG